MLKELELSKENIREVWEEYQETKDEVIKNKLVEFYFPFVQKIAIKQAERLSWRVQPDELASFGVDGLYHAIDGFNLERQVKFESYASLRIQGAMIDGLRRQDPIPRSVRIASDQFNRHQQRLETHFGHRIPDTECVSLLGMDESGYHKNHKKYSPTSYGSIDNVDGGSGEGLKQDVNYHLIDNDADDPAASLCRREFFCKLLGKSFNETERKIVYLYYYEGMTMDKVASKIDLSESRVSQMHKKIMERLKDKITRNPEYFSGDIGQFLSRFQGNKSIF